MMRRVWLFWAVCCLLSTAVVWPASAQKQPDPKQTVTDKVGQETTSNNATQTEPQPHLHGETETDWWSRVEVWLRADAYNVAKQVGLALVLFLVGWLLAKFLAWTVFRLLRRTEWDDRLLKRLGLAPVLQREGAPPHRSARIAGTIVFWLLMLLVVVATLQYAGLSQAAEPIQTFVDRIATAMPLIGKAIVILLVAYALGLGLSKLTSNFLDQSRVDDRFLQLTRKPEDEVAATEPTEPTEPTEAEEGTQAETVATSRPFSEAAGRVVFWFMMVLGLAGAVDALKIGPLAHAMENAIDEIVGMLPRIGLAALLLASGYVLGRIARATIDNLLDSAGFNRLADKARLNRLLGERKASDVVGIFAMVFIILQLAVAALNEVSLHTLSGPLTNMMAQFWNALPSVGLATLIVVAGVIGAGILRDLVEKSLDNLGFSEWMDRLGVSAITERSERLQKPHQIIGLIVYVAIILLAVVQALEKLDLQRWATYVNGFLRFSVARLAIALVIVGVGLGVANYVRDLILARRKDETDDSVRWIAMFTRYAILVFAVCMGVHHLEIGDNFVLVTFSLLFGSLCLALALSFGLGSRDVAGEIVRRQYDRAREELSEQAPAQPKTTPPPSE